jgi:hypothetical protein
MRSGVSPIFMRIPRLASGLAALSCLNMDYGCSIFNVLVSIAPIPVVLPLAPVKLFINGRKME